MTTNERLALYGVTAVLAVFLLVKGHIIPAVAVVAFIASPFDDIIIAAVVLHEKQKEVK